LFLVLAAAVYWTYRNRERFGGGGSYAKDPVCGMQVERDNPGATSQHDGHAVYFCSDRCKTKFDNDPKRYDAGSPEPMSRDASAEAVDPVCGMNVDPANAAARLTHDGHDLSFCSLGCRERFVADPTAFTSKVT
jgi:YHS domain-containing protein